MSWRSVLYQSMKYYSTQRPPLNELIPPKKVLNRLLFDKDSRLGYKKVVKIYDAVYSKIDTPDQIQLPSFVVSDDLMILREVLGIIRKTTNTINKNLVDIEKELLQQAGELGNNDAIALLSFSAIQDPNTTKQDYDDANNLIKQLSDIKHPLVFKLAGDLAYTKKMPQNAETYWLQFLELESDTIEASHVYTNLGIHYYSLHPKPNLTKAKYYLEKALRFGELDNTILRAHFFYSQLFTITDPKVSKYHLEICASRGLQESFKSLGFMELNVFGDFVKSLEWFKLGVKSNGDLSCHIGQFDCYVFLKEYKQALSILQKLISIQESMQKHKLKIHKNMEATYNINKSLLETFFNTRQSSIEMVRTNL